MIPNKENITKIIMKPFAECLCAIGQDWYHIQFIIEFFPDKFYPDYMDITKYISKEISGKELNIESAIDLLGSMLQSTYSPKELKITGIVNDVITHFPVEVIKQY